MKNERKDNLRESINRTFLITIGMTYDEYALLDHDEQRRIMTEYHKQHPNKSDECLVLIGSGESAMIQRVRKGTRILTPDGYYIAGQTAEEQMRKLEDDMIDRISKRSYSQPEGKTKKLGKRLR